MDIREELKCAVCGDELRELGAILLSPPDNNGFVKKEHICVECYKPAPKLHPANVEVEKDLRELSFTNREDIVFFDGEDYHLTENAVRIIQSLTPRITGANILLAILKIVPLHEVYDLSLPIVREVFAEQLVRAILNLGREE